MGAITTRMEWEDAKAFVKANPRFVSSELKEMVQDKDAWRSWRIALIVATVIVLLGIVAIAIMAAGKVAGLQNLPMKTFAHMVEITFTASIIIGVLSYRVYKIGHAQKKIAEDKQKVGNPFLASLIDESIRMAGREPQDPTNRFEKFLLPKLTKETKERYMALGQAFIKIAEPYMIRPVRAIKT